MPIDTARLNFGTTGFRLEFNHTSTILQVVLFLLHQISVMILVVITNHFTVSGLASTDVVLDSPTNNFSTWNALFRGGEKIIKHLCNFNFK